MNKDNSGPAFPETHVISHGDAPGWMGRTGMTLRDYFAASAMHGQIGNQTRREDLADLAERSYLAADALLAERGK